ncbi:MAG: hypothetical protein JW963_10040 [Anaerolineales bacterium]|nr:hypothetical protein [Anaerolineales bacterium]
MRAALDSKRMNISGVGAWLVPVVLFWLVLVFEIPYSFTRYFHRYDLVVFLSVAVLYYLSFRLRGNQSVLAAFGLTMLLFALTLSYLWTSGFSDNFVIGGLLPYKDAKNYYLGANLLLNGLPIRIAGQALGRPLFPGFLSSLLLLTGQNLKVVLAILVQLAGIGLYLSARQIRYAMGALAGMLYITFMYFYFQNIAGYAMSESLGFIGGCFGFALIWHAARNRKWLDLLLGLGVLMVAVSARAGAFFIFPLLALWAGWMFRGAKRFSLLAFSLLFAMLVGGYFFINTVYPRLVGVPQGSSFSNFAYTLYGQVRGGAGWHSAIDELGTRDPSRVYRAAWAAFLATPSDFFKGVAEAYTDFFLPGSGSIFVFGTKDHLYELDLVLWGLTIVILLLGLYRLVFKLCSAVSTMLLAGFIGIFLSIPFLPPIDGGMRFYASTMPFFFVLLAVGVSRFPDRDVEPAPVIDELFSLRFGSVSLLVLTVLLPPVTLRASTRPALTEPVCSPQQRPFIIDVKPGSYIDLVKGENTFCGLAPRICFEDFLNHNTEMYIDDFYQELDALAASSQTDMRVIPTINLLDGYFQYFVISDSQVLGSSSQALLSGCATRIQTENQRIFLVESISPSDK